MIVHAGHDEPVESSGPWEATSCPVVHIEPLGVRAAASPTNGRLCGTLIVNWVESITRGPRSQLPSDSNFAPAELAQSILVGTRNTNVQGGELDAANHEHSSSLVFLVLCLVVFEALGVRWQER